MRFDFVDKLQRFPERIRAVLDDNYESALSTVYLDVNVDICNHACSFCDGFFRSLKAESFPWSRLKRLVQELAELRVQAVVLAGDRGEPLLHPHIGDLLRGLTQARIRVGIYSNGTVPIAPFATAMREVAFLRLSADAGSATTHRVMHVYPEARNDFERLCENVERLAGRVDDLGMSFVLDPSNYHEIELAAEVFLGLGANFIEYKPKYEPGYQINSGWLKASAPEIRERLETCKRRWGTGIVVNNQVESLLTGTTAPSLRVAPRTCRTSILRLVVSPHGCYTCTPFRGENERRVGDIMSSSLREIVDSEARRALLLHPCDRRCAYHAQNEFILNFKDSDKADVDESPSKPQDYFI